MGAPKRGQIDSQERRILKGARRDKVRETVEENNERYRVGNV